MDLEALQPLGVGPRIADEDRLAVLHPHHLPVCGKFKGYFATSNYAFIVQLYSAVQRVSMCSSYSVLAVF
jgi:hypothetical protein